MYNYYNFYSVEGKAVKSTDEPTVYISDEQEKQLRELFPGTPQRAIAARMDRSKTWVHRALRQLGLTRSRRTVDGHPPKLCCPHCGRVAHLALTGGA